MTENDSNGKTPSWDLRQHRLAQIGRKANETDERLTDVYRERTLTATQDWFAAVKVLWSTVKHYVEDEEKIETVEDELCDFHSDLKSDEAVEKISFKDDVQQLHDKVHSIRIEEAGLDIPMKTEKEEDVKEFYL